MTFAFIFSDVGVGEWFVLLAVILVVIGPKRLPEAARKFGAVYSKFRRAADSFKRQLMDMDTAFDRAVTEAENEANQAFSVPEDPPPATSNSQLATRDSPPATSNPQPATSNPQPATSNPSPASADGNHQEP